MVVTYNWIQQLTVCMVVEDLRGGEDQVAFVYPIFYLGKNFVLELSLEDLILVSKRHLGKHVRLNFRIRSSKSSAPVCVSFSDLRSAHAIFHHLKSQRGLVPQSFLRSYPFLGLNNLFHLGPHLWPANIQSVALHHPSGQNLKD